MREFESDRYLRDQNDLELDACTREEAEYRWRRQRVQQRGQPQLAHWQLGRGGWAREDDLVTAEGDGDGDSGARQRRLPQ